VLVLTRRAGESIVIGDDVRVVVLDVRGDTVRLGIEAPRSVQVHRAEVYAEVQAANAAAAAPADLDSVAGRLRKLARPSPRTGRPSAQRASGQRGDRSAGAGGPRQGQTAPPDLPQPPQQQPGQQSGQQPGQRPAPQPRPPAGSGAPPRTPSRRRPVPHPPHQRPGPVGEVSSGTAGDPAEAHTPDDPNPGGPARRPGATPSPGEPQRAGAPAEPRPVPRPPAHRPSPPGE